MVTAEVMLLISNKLMYCNVMLARSNLIQTLRVHANNRQKYLETKCHNLMTLCRRIFSLLTPEIRLPEENQRQILNNLHHVAVCQCEFVSGKNVWCQLLCLNTGHTSIKKCVHHK